MWSPDRIWEDVFFFKYTWKIQLYHIHLFHFWEGAHQLQMSLWIYNDFCIPLDVIKSIVFVQSFQWSTSQKCADPEQNCFKPRVFTSAVLWNVDSWFDAPSPQKKSFRRSCIETAISRNTVDGRNPAPADKQFIQFVPSFFWDFLTSQVVVWDFWSINSMALQRCWTSLRIHRILPFGDFLWCLFVCLFVCLSVCLSVWLVGWLVGCLAVSGWP